MVNEGLTNENGAYTIEDVAKGSLTITVSKEGFKQSSKTIDVSENTSVEFVLEEETVDTRSVDFTIQDSEEEGISGARIRLVNAETEEETTNANGGTGSSGGSSINELAYGNYNVTVTKEDYADVTFTLTVGEELAVSGDGAEIISNKVVVTMSA